MYKLYVSSSSGAFFCHRCGTKGSWFDFKKMMGDLGSGGNYNGNNNNSNSSIASFDNAQDEELQLIKIGEVKKKLVEYQESFKDDKYPSLREYIERRGITKDTAITYGIGVSMSFFTK